MPNPNGPQFVNNPPKHRKLLVMFSNGFVTRRVFSELPNSCPDAESDEAGNAGEERPQPENAAEHIDAKGNGHREH